MPYEISLNSIPAGYAAQSVKKGDEIRLIMREFVSSEDGDLLIERLDGIPTELLAKLPVTAGITPSKEDHMLAIIRRNSTATVYVNELPFIIRTRVKNSKEKGDKIFADDIIDIESLSLGDLSIPYDAGIVFIFSVGWRKGLYFDFFPLTDSNYTRNYDLEKLLGSYFAYLTEQYLFKIKDEEWKRLFEQQWFPFIALKRATIKSMISHVRSNWNVDDLLDEIVSEVKVSARNTIKRLENSPIMLQHIELINRAVERYLEDDYISATSILYPRIEGVLRSLHYDLRKRKDAKQKALVEAVIEARQQDRHNASLLLPNMFYKYLSEVYFASFEPGKSTIVSRNSVAHGVADQKDFSRKSATVGLLVLDQIFYYLP